MKYCILSIALFFCSFTLFAQINPPAVVQGTILNNRTPVHNAIVRIDSLSLQAVSDSNGVYTLTNVPEGTHQITVQASGFVAQTRRVVVPAAGLSALQFSLPEENVVMVKEVVISKKSEKEKLENSAKAVDVIDTKEAKLQTADLGEVMAKSQGISVRRSGGLGSGTRFSLNGLTGDQIRFFLDGVPLDFTEYSSGISNIPVNLVDRVEVYKGVVPVQFGADALGGAVNIASPKMYHGWSGLASYQTGSFGTHRAAADLKYFSDSSGFFAGGGGFYDYAKNNYSVNVDVANEKGKLSETTVPRFHDTYKAGSANLIAGFRDKRWAKELSIKTFYSELAKDVQHNSLMTGIPYGDVVALKKSAGVNFTYRVNVGRKVSMQVLSGYSYTERQFIDTSHSVYDWHGNVILIKNRAGEISGQEGASHQFTWDKNLYARILTSWKLSGHHTLRLSTAPTHVLRTGDEKYSGTYDPLTSEGKLLTWVNGLEYEMNAFNKKLENIFFVKDYLQNAESRETTYGGLTKRQVHYYGAGNAMRYKLSDRVAVKASYEYATRLPRPDELFGDGQFIINSLDLEPERSHNGNLELALRNKSTAKANWQIQANTFLRKVDNLILLIPSTDRTDIYRNVFEATSAGVELSGNWTSPREHISLSANTTYQNFYNSSNDGLFASFYGDRIPNTPYFFSNGSASYSFHNMIKNNDRLSLFWGLRYVHEFYRSWESAGIKAFKLSIPNQQIHNAGITYKTTVANTSWALTGEIQNLMNRRIYDYYGVQKPGRGYFVKLTTQF